MKVFLSHSTKDKQFVEALAAELEAENIQSWICEVDVEFGGNFVAKIEEGLRDADLTVLFWSPEAARSDWTRLEWTSVTAREISESRTRLGVVLLRDARNKLVEASLLRMLDRDRQRFQLHALLREELRNLVPLGELQAAHAAALEKLFADLGTALERMPRVPAGGDPGCAAFVGDE
jgi:TIR domain